MIGYVRLFELLICIEIFMQYDKHIKFLTKLNYIDRLLMDKLSGNMKYKQLKWHSYCVALIWILFHFIMMVIIISFSLNDIDTIKIYFLYFQSFIDASIHYLQIIFYVHMLNYRFKFLYEILNEMSLIETHKFPSHDFEENVCHVILHELGLSDNVISFVDSSSAEYILNKMIIVRKVYHEL